MHIDLPLLPWRLVLVAERREPRRPSFRVPLRVAIVAVALVAVGLGVYRANDPAARYRRGEHDTFLRVVGSGRIRNGDTEARVLAVLGPPRSPANPRLEALTIASIQEYPPAYPDGYRVGDVFRQYWVTSNSYGNLQFRDGRLVNFDPRRFE